MMEQPSFVIEEGTVPHHRRFTVAVPAVVLAVTVCAAGCTSGSSQLVNLRHPTSTPTLPPANSTHTVIVLAPASAGVAPTQQQLDSSASVLVKRFVAAGFPAPTVTDTSAHGLRLDVAAPVGVDQVESLVAQGILTFRTVLNTTVAVSTTGGGSGQTGGAGDDASMLVRVKSKLGNAYALAENLTGPPSDQATIDKLAPFSKLSAAEVAVVPTGIQFN